MEVILLLTLLRLVVPLLIFRYPLLGAFAAIWADSVDWHIFPFKSESDYVFYQRWDKILDIYYLSIEAYVSLFWKDRFARNISIGLFLYRIFGVVLFEITAARFLLLLFPNLFEFFFLFVLIYKKFIHKKIRWSFGHFSIIIILLLLPKLGQEYSQHVLYAAPWEWVIIVFQIVGLLLLFGFG